jgi:uncharacterized protein DUF1706
VSHKAELLASLRREHEALAETLGALTPEQMTTPGIHGDDGGNWAVKDVLCHITWWEQSVFGWLGLPPAVPRSPIPEGASGDDEINAAIYAGNKGRELAEVLASFERSYQALVSALEAASEERLGQSRQSDPGGGPIWELVPGNTFEHYDAHNQAIRAWMSRQDAG